MTSIWKFPIALDDHIEVQMPVGAKVLSVQVQRATICMWALVETEAKQERRRFCILPTGGAVYSYVGQFIGTFQLAGGNLVFHLFEERGIPNVSVR